MSLPVEWIEVAHEKDKAWRADISVRLLSDYKAGTVRPAKVLAWVSNKIERAPSSFFVHKELIRGRIPTASLDVLSAARPLTNHFDGIAVFVDKMLFEKKSAFWTLQFGYCWIQRHAIERFQERANANEADIQAALWQIGLMSQPFNSANCFGFSEKLPLVLPFRDGLFLGQSDILTRIPDGGFFKFSKSGAEIGTPAQPGIAILFGNQPRAMRVRTFVGGDEGLSQRKKKAHDKLVPFYQRYGPLFEKFARKAYFEFDVDDLTHSMHIEMKQVAETIRKGNLLEALTQPANLNDEQRLEQMFRDGSDRDQLLQMLAEYSVLMKTEEMREVLETAEAHLR